jgi:hypothetical protein
LLDPDPEELGAEYDFGADTLGREKLELERDEDEETRLAAPASTAITPIIKKPNKPAIIFFMYISLQFDNS